MRGRGGQARFGARGPQRPWWALATALALLGVLPLVALALLVEGRATAAVRAEARAGLAGTTSLTSQFLEEQLVGIQKVVDSYARRRLLVQALEAPGGPDTRELTRHMTELRDARTDVLNVAGIADTKGIMLAGTVMPPPGTDFSARDWHRSALRTRAPYVSEAIVGTSPGSPLALAISAPVLDAAGRVRAVLVVGYTLTSLQAFVGRFAVEQDVDITVTDQRGVLVARPGSAPTTLDSRRGDPRVAAALAGRRGVEEGDRSAGGERVLSAYAPVTRLGWTVVAELPRDRAYAEVARLRRGVLALTVPLALLFSVSGVLLARSLRSRNAARDRAQELASINSAVLEAAYEGLSLIDPDGRPLLRNATTQGLGRDLGTQPDGDVYAELERLAPEMSDPEAFRSAAAAMAADRDLEVSDEFTHVASNRSFHRYSRPVRDADGALIGRLFVLRETTAEKAAEATIRQAKQEAEVANAAKTDFLSRMSHELRTPLHAILGFGALLGREDLTPGQQECLDQMVRGGRHLLDLINEVLDLQRVEHGELSLSVEPVELSEVVEEVLAFTATLAAGRGTRVRSAGLAEGRLHVVADRQRLKQVLLNLVSNAVKYGREGGEVTVSGRPADDRTVRVDVHDDGPGIPADKLPLLFHRFERLGADRSDVEGTGLGLALSEQLVVAMGGEIGAESAPGQGATFWFALPASAPPSTLSGAAGPQEGRGLRSGPAARRVLLVEDNPANAALVRTVLTKRPHVELLVAGQGAQALDLAAHHHPDLVLLDLNLPDMGGREVLRRLRDELGPDGPAVVVLSADATPRQVERLLAEGADGYLTKPFAIHDFLAAIDGDSTADEKGVILPTDDDGALDLEIVATVRGLAASPKGQPSLLQDLVTTYVTDAESRLEQLRRALDADDLDEVRAQAHALRGGSGGVGARRVAALGQDLETAADAGDRTAAALAFTRLTAALPATRSALARAYGLAVDP